MPDAMKVHGWPARAVSALIALLLCLGLVTPAFAGDADEVVWLTGNLGGMTDAAGAEIAPRVEALERSEIHPSAVFELEDSGFWASHFLSLVIALITILILALVLLQVFVIITFARRRKKRQFERDKTI